MGGATAAEPPETPGTLTLPEFRSRDKNLVRNLTFTDPLFLFCSGRPDQPHHLLATPASA